MTTKCKKWILQDIYVVAWWLLFNMNFEYKIVQSDNRFFLKEEEEDIFSSKPFKYFIMVCPCRICSTTITEGFGQITSAPCFLSVLSSWCLFLQHLNSPTQLNTMFEVKDGRESNGLGNHFLCLKKINYFQIMMIINMIMLMGNRALWHV